MWEASEGAEGYHLEVSTNLFFTGIIVDSVIAGQNYFDLEDLDPDRKYFWRVSAINEDGKGVHSDSRNFRTQEAVSVFENIINNREYLRNIFPNPASNHAEVELLTDKPGIASLSLYDISGRMVKNIFSKYLPAGRFNIEIDLGDLPKGIYTLVYESSDIRASRKLVIVE
jgi:hypothetical protein